MCKINYKRIWTSDQIQSVNEKQKGLLHQSTTKLRNNENDGGIGSRKTLGTAIISGCNNFEKISKKFLLS